MECLWKINDDPCVGVVEKRDLFPDCDTQEEYEGHSVHAMPCCEAHRADHYLLIRKALKVKGEALYEDDSRSSLKQFDPECN